MGAAGHYSDRFFEPDEKDVPVGVAPRTEVVGLGQADEPAAPGRRRWTRVVGALAAVGIVAVILAQQGTSTPTSDDQAQGVAGEDAAASGTEVASRSGVTTVQLSATAVDGFLWKSRGYSYVVRLWNGTSTPLAVMDVSATASGTEILWNDPVVLPAQGAARLKVDFLLVNCAAAGAPAPERLRLRLRPPGSEQLVVADIAVDQAAKVVNESPAPRCPGGSDTDADS
jgi:hypothetical protein